MKKRVTIPVYLRGGSPIDTNAIAAGSGLLGSFTVYEPEKTKEWHVSLPLPSLLTAPSKSKLNMDFML
jgi:hypothetical protein